MCRIGVTEAERRDPQRLEVDLDLYADLEEAGRTGDLAHTIDYTEVSQVVRGLLEARPFSLIEVAGAAILGEVFARFNPRRAVVRVRKYVLPRVKHIEVRLERESSPR